MSVCGSVGVIGAKKELFVPVCVVYVCVGVRTHILRSLYIKVSSRVSIRNIFKQMSYKTKHFLMNSEISVPIN